MTGQRAAPGARRRRGRRRRARLGAGGRVPALRPRARRARRLDVRQRGDGSASRSRAHAGPLGRPRGPLGDRCWRCSARRTSPPSAGPSSSTTRSSARARCGGPRAPTPRCCSSPSRGGRSRSRSTATVAGSPATPTSGRSRPCSSAPRTSPASAPSRSGSPTASTSATPRSRASPGSSTARSAGSPTPAPRSACPVVGGNVSLYNETEHGPIYPTPVVGMVGELPDPAVTAPGRARARATRSFLVGPFAPSLAGSELAKLRGELRRRAALDRIAPVAAALELVRELVRDGTARGAHDVSDGGLACALAEMAIAGGVGAALDLDPLIELRGCSGETALFGEGPGGIVISVEPAAAEAARRAGRRAGVDAHRARDGRRRAARDRGRRAGGLAPRRRRRAGLALARPPAERVDSQACDRLSGHAEQPSPDPLGAADRSRCSR